jgi:hypothetical protein
MPVHEVVEPDPEEELLLLFTMMYTPSVRRGASFFRAVLLGG